MTNSVANLPRRGLIGLPKRRLLALAGRRGERIESLRGSVWVTQDDDQRDLVLAAGEAHVIERDGPVLVQALEAALVCVQRLPAAAGASRWQRLLAVLRRPALPA